MSNFMYDSTDAWRQYKKQIISVRIDTGVSSIGSGAFDECSNLVSISIPTSVESIYRNAFSGCKKLESIVIPESVIEIGPAVFARCDLLKKAGPIGSNCNIEYGWATEIPDDAFFNCGSLTDIVFPNGIISIGERSFEHCSALQNIMIPDNSLTSVGIAAFNECQALKDVVFSGVKAEWDNITVGADNEPLQTATIHCIEPDFFLPSSLKTIEEEAFSGGVFIYVKLPENAVSIEKNAFYGCSELKYVYIPRATTDIDSLAFNTTKNLTILGKAGSCAEDYAQEHNFAFVEIS